MTRIIGKEFGRLTITKVYDYKGRAYADCSCSCQRSATALRVRVASLKSGNTKSCGCIRREKMSENRHVHKTTEKYEFPPNDATCNFAISFPVTRHDGRTMENLKPAIAENTALVYYSVRIPACMHKRPAGMPNHRKFLFAYDWQTATVECQHANAYDYRFRNHLDTLDIVENFAMNHIDAIEKALTYINTKTPPPDDLDCSVVMLTATQRGEMNTIDVLSTEADPGPHWTFNVKMREKGKTRYQKHKLTYNPLQRSFVSQKALTRLLTAFKGRRKEAKQHVIDSITQYADAIYSTITKSEVNKWATKWT